MFVSLKKPGVAAGRHDQREMDAMAALAERHSFGEMRVTHDQNLVLADVPQNELHALYQQLDELGLATPNIGTLNDMICCPGRDFCSLANATSIPVAAQINERFDNLDYLYDLGEIQIKMSGCMNACGHHHVGHIGILGVDKHGEEWYQITLGGSPANDASLGEVIGPSVPKPASPNDRAHPRRVSSNAAGARTRVSCRRCGASAWRRSRSASMRQLIKDRDLRADRWTMLRDAAVVADAAGMRRRRSCPSLMARASG